MLSAGCSEPREQAPERWRGVRYVGSSGAGRNSVWYGTWIA